MGSAAEVPTKRGRRQALRIWGRRQGGHLPHLIRPLVCCPLPCDCNSLPVSSLHRQGLLVPHLIRPLVCCPWV